MRETSSSRTFTEIVPSRTDTLEGGADNHVQTLIGMSSKRVVVGCNNFYKGCVQYKGGIFLLLLPLFLALFVVTGGSPCHNHKPPTKMMVS